TLTFIVEEEERLVLANWAAQGCAILISAILVKLAFGQKTLGIGRLVVEIAVHRTMQVVGSGLGDYVNNAAQSSAIFGSEAIVHHTEFAPGFLRGGRPLRTRPFAELIGAIHCSCV